VQDLTWWLMTSFGGLLVIVFGAWIKETNQLVRRIPLIEQRVDQMREGQDGLSRRVDDVLQLQSEAANQLRQLNGGVKRQAGE
jgi:hypothetical protein